MRVGGKMSRNRQIEGVLIWHTILQLDMNGVKDLGRSIVSERSKQIREGFFHRFTVN